MPMEECLRRGTDLLSVMSLRGAILARVQEHEFHMRNHEDQDAYTFLASILVRGLF